MKVCSRCHVEKEASLYYKNKRSSDGYAYHCKECQNKATKQWKKDNPQLDKEMNKRAQEKRREAKAASQRIYYQNNREYYSNISSKYKGRYPSKHKTPAMKAYAKLYRENNKERIQYHRRKRKALIRGSVINFSENEYENVMNHFGGKCAITGSTDIHMDHFIPISTGYGDTVIGNMIPLDASLNLSKNASNPFEWIKNRNDIDLKRFEDVVFYLANLNGLTVAEYEAHVYNCFD